MEFEGLLELVGDEPVFETGLLLAGNVDVDNVRLQVLDTVLQRVED